VQEAKYEVAMRDLNKAQAQLDEKQRELDAVQAMYDRAMKEKQVTISLLERKTLNIILQMHLCCRRPANKFCELPRAVEGLILILIAGSWDPIQEPLALPIRNKLINSV
jgi:exonuclease VII small subunit